MNTAPDPAAASSPPGQRQADRPVTATATNADASRTKREGRQPVSDGLRPDDRFVDTPRPPRHSPAAPMRAAAFLNAVRGHRLGARALDVREGTLPLTGDGLGTFFSQP